MAIEIAPEGTRELLTEVAKVFRGYEAHHREQAEAIRSGIEGEELDPTAKASVTVAANGRDAKADTNARLAGRIEALLEGWEDAQ